MKTLLAFPSTASFAQQAALAFHENQALEAFLTAYVHHDDGLMAKALALAPGGLRARIEPQLRRRSIDAIPSNILEERPFWEIVRTIASKAGASAPMVDRLWNHLSHDFTRAAGKHLKSQNVDAIYAYEYTALEAFRDADKYGVKKILDFPSQNSRQYEELQRREKKRFPELASAHEDYFTARFEKRQKRRDDEMNAADLIVTNSSVTRQSHIDGGADPDKTIAVPYGAPPALEKLPPHTVEGPLKAIWAGTFSIRKGAHYFVEAWRALNAGHDAVVDVYGAIAVPDRVWSPKPEGLDFHGSVPRTRLFDAFDRADVMVFPTLSDGFGMVVTEAFARGLPVITTDQAGASDLVEHGKNGLIITAGDPSEIQSALDWCLNHRSELGAMRARALETAQNWQWSDYRNALYQGVIGFFSEN